MRSAAIPATEARRLEALRQYGVLDTRTEQAFDDLASLAAHICQAPVAMISLVDENRQWFKSHLGWAATETPRDVSFCGHAIHSADLFVVTDARTDERFADNPLVTGDPRIAFYAGTPLVTPAGDALGTLCVVDHVPRQLTEAQLDALRALGRQVMSQLELRRRTAELAESERLLRTMFDSEPECVKLLGPDGSLHMMNRAGLAMIEADSLEQVAGQSLYSLVSAEHQAAMRALTDRVFRGEEGSLLFEIVGLRGTRRWLETHAAPLFDESGKVSALLGVTRDVTERKAAEDGLRASERNYRLLFEQATDGIVVASQDGQFLDVNPATSEMTGYTREQLLAMSVPDLLMSDEIPRIASDMARLGNGRAVASQWRLRHADGSPFLGEMTFRQLPDGRLQGFLRDLTDRKVVEDALHETDERLRRAVSAGRVGLWDWDLSTDTVYYSTEWKRQIGYEDYEIRNHADEWRSRVHPDDLASCLEAIERFINRVTDSYEVEFRFKHKKGTYRHILAQASLIVDDNGRAVGMRGSHVDITDRAELHAQFLQAQKMESVGRLAGGIAHDFNNLLTVINGTADLVESALKPEDPLRQDLEQIHVAGNRAAKLTRQLLALSRQQIMRPDVLDLRQVVSGMESMLQRLIGEDIEFAFASPADLGHVRADQSQIEQVILNLAVNARDAMPFGGRLTIETRNVMLDPGYTATHPSLTPGPFVLLAVSDTGIGMDEETRKRAFEPFFTANPNGTGTGLGLSTVYGIVRQSGGATEIRSELGQGATVEIYLPQVDRPLTASQPSRPIAAGRGSETILLVEDERSLRSLCRRILEGAGYRVLEASTGEEALALLDRDERPVHLMLTDVVMPGMSGRELATQLATRRPDTKVLYTSGYTDDAILRHGVLDDASRFVPKPYTAEDLKQKVRDVLDS